MPDETVDEEQLRRLYHQITSESAEAFAHEIGEIISSHLPKSPITIYGIRIHDEDLYPNDYSSLLLNVLSARGYSVASYPLNLNGPGNSIASIPLELIDGKPNIIVDIHMSRVFGIYLAQLRARGASKTLYACPTPPPGRLWDYVEEGNRLLQLRKPSV